MALQVWLPPSARPKYHCRVCSKPFFEGEQRAWQRHVVQCAEDNIDMLMEQTPYQGFHHPDSMDQEHIAHIRRTQGW